MIRTSIAIFLLLLPSLISSHSGRTNSAGCHAGSQPYHCHARSTISPPTLSNTVPIVGELIEARKELQLEAKHNRQFCQSIGGQVESRHYYAWSDLSSHIQVDCETSDTVWEGGLDRRSSLDSIQQALFASQLTGQTSGHRDLQYGWSGRNLRIPDTHCC